MGRRPAALNVEVETSGPDVKSLKQHVHGDAVDLESVSRKDKLASVKTQDARFWKHGGELGGGYLPDASPAAFPGPSAAPPAPPAPTSTKTPAAAGTGSVTLPASSSKPPPSTRKGQGGAPAAATASPVKSNTSQGAKQQGGGGTNPGAKRFGNLAGVPKGYKPKDFSKKDRTEIEGEIAKLRAATAANWAPYAMLREPATEEQRRRQEEREREEKARERAARKARRMGRRMQQDSNGAAGGDQAGGRPGTPDGTGLKEMSIGEAAKQGGVWDMDPAYNRDDPPGEDMRIDDPRYVRAPGWSRVGALQRLVLITEAGDAEVLAVALEYCKDPEGSVRCAALELVSHVAKRGDATAKDACIQCLKDKVANVRREACYALVGLAQLGDKPSKQLKTALTFTSADIQILHRDAEVIEALNGTLDDNVGSVRKAAADTLDKINAGWQRYRYAEIRRDSGKMSPRSARPLPSVTVASVAPDVLWDGAPVKHSELAKEQRKVGADGGFNAGDKSHGVGDQYGTRHKKLAGKKYNWYMQALRTERQVALFEESKVKAAMKHVVEKEVNAEPGARGVTTQWMGVEWVDRTRRTFRGDIVHEKGDGVDKDRDHVAAPYNEGYNGWCTPLGYAFV